MDDKTVSSLISRIERLEREVFGSGRADKKPVKRTDAVGSFTGATGGIRLLISKKFFAGKKTLAEVRDALAKAEYHYSGPAVQMALGRLSTRKGPLLSLEVGGRKVYVTRK